MAMTFVVCVEKTSLGDFSGDDVEIGRLYEVLDNEAGHGMIRIIDESGEDYLYPAAWFEPVMLGETSVRRLQRALTGVSVHS